jgi:hypothetical protein
VTKTIMVDNESESMGMGRRKFLTIATSTALGAGAGCTSDGKDEGPKETGTSPADPTENPDQPSTETGSKSTAEGYNETEGTADGSETGTPGEDNEGQNEVRYQDSFERRDMSWIEVQNMENIEFPESALDSEGSPEGNGVEDLSSYEELLDAIADRESRSNAEASTYIIGFRDLAAYEGSGEYNGQVRFFGSANKIAGDWGLSGEGNAEEGAIERFLQENVHGYVDHSEDIDQELLEYASE